MASTINADDGVVSGSAGVKTSADNSGVLELQSNGTTQFTLGSSSVVINEAGADVDFRVEGDTDPNLFVVDASTDRIGMGTNAPSSKLHLSGAATADARLTFTQTTAGLSGQIQQGSTGFAISALGTNSLLFDTNGVNRAVIDVSGNLGLGTTSPGTLLHLNATNPVLRFSGSTSGNCDIQTDGVSFLINADSGNTAAGSNIAFRVDNTERARITSAGELLVGGTTSLNATSGSLSLQATGGGSFNLFRNDTSVISGDVLGAINFWGNDTTSNTPAALAYIASIASGTHGAGDNPTDLVFATTPDGSATVAEKMRLTAAGNLLVGTTSQSSNGSHKVVIESASTVGTISSHLALIGDSATNGQGPQILFSESGNGTAWAGGTIGFVRTGANGQGDLVFGTRGTSGDANTTTTERARITSGGNLLAGDSSALTGARIDSFGSANGVAGIGMRHTGATAGQWWRIYMQNDSKAIFTNAAGTGVSLTYGGTSWSTASDEKLKENISDIGTVLDKVTNYRCVNYSLKATQSASADKIGFIAQDWEADFPNVVDRDENDELSMKYTETIPVLLKAIQEQQAMIEDLKAKVAALESK